MLPSSYSISLLPPYPQKHTRAQSLSQSQSLSVVEHDQGLQQRTRELDEIANSIASLAELFKDLSVLVIDQGTLLDSVEYNIEQTAVRVGDAVKELQEATRWVISSFPCVYLFMYATFRYQKNTGRRKCIFLLLLIIFGLIIVLIFKPRHHASSSPPPSPVPAIPAIGPTSDSRLRLRSTASRKLPLPYPPSRPLNQDPHSVLDVWELWEESGSSILSKMTRT